MPENNEYVEIVVLLSARLADQPDYDRVIYPKLEKLIEFIERKPNG